MPDTRPNILLITTDQQRGDCLGSGSGWSRLLANTKLGLDWSHRHSFSSRYAECPSCIPALRGLMTGTAPAANGAVGFKGAEWNPPHTLAGRIVCSRLSNRNDRQTASDPAHASDTVLITFSWLMPPEATIMITSIGCRNIPPQ